LQQQPKSKHDPPVMPIFDGWQLLIYIAIVLAVVVFAFVRAR
jgi:hypothetical protein